MPNDKHHADPTENEEFGSAGKPTGMEEPAATGSAGLYAPRIHEEGEEALEEGTRKAEKPPR